MSGLRGTCGLLAGVGQTGEFCLLVSYVGNAIIQTSCVELYVEKIAEKTSTTTRRHDRAVVEFDVQLSARHAVRAGRGVLSSELSQASLTRAGGRGFMGDIRGDCGSGL